MVQNWDINATAQQLTPNIINKSPFIEWLQALLSPLVTLYTGFKNWMISTGKLATYSISTIKLQALLNDNFDPTLRRITIHNTWYLKPKFWVGKKVEVPKVYAGKKTESPKLYIGLRSEYIGNGNFVVTAAVGSLNISQQQQIKSTVNKYRFAGTIPYYRFSNGVPF